MCLSLWTRPLSAGLVRSGLASVRSRHRPPGLDGVLLHIGLPPLHHVVSPLSGPAPARPRQHVQQRPAGGSDPDFPLVLCDPVDSAPGGPEGARLLRPPPRPLLPGVRGLPAAPGPEAVLLRAPSVRPPAAGPAAALRLQLLALVVGGRLGPRGQAVRPRREGGDELGQNQAASSITCCLDGGGFIAS